MKQYKSDQIPQQVIENVNKILVDFFFVSKNYI